MKGTREEIHYQVSTFVRFKARDAFTLKVLAARTWTFDENERDLYEKAGDCAANDTPLLIQCMSKHELDQIVAKFHAQGIAATIEPTRLEAPPDSMWKRYKR